MRNTSLLNLETVTGGVLQKKVFLKISTNSQENVCARVSFLIKTLAQVLSCEFCENFKNTFVYRTLPVAASVNTYSTMQNIKGPFMAKNTFVAEVTFKFDRSQVK